MHGLSYNSFTEGVPEPWSQTPPKHGNGEQKSVVARLRRLPTRTVGFSVPCHNTEIGGRV